jgi:hypothetical protein
MWFVTRHADVVDVLRDPVRFTTDAPRSTIRDTFGSQMLSAEGDEQRRYKTATAAPFTARAVREQAGPAIDAIVARLLDGVATPAGAELRGDSPRRWRGNSRGRARIPERYYPAIRLYDAFAASANFTESSSDVVVKKRLRHCAAQPPLESPASRPCAWLTWCMSDDEMLSASLDGLSHRRQPDAWARSHPRRSPNCQPDSPRLWCDAQAAVQAAACDQTLP